MTTTYYVRVQNGSIEIKPYISPEVAPAAPGYEKPLKTVAAVKSYARFCVSMSGFDSNTKKAAREAISLITKADCLSGSTIAF